METSPFRIELVVFGAEGTTIRPDAVENDCLRCAPHAEETIVRVKRAGIRVAMVSTLGRVVLDAMLDRLGWRTARLLDATVVVGIMNASHTAEQLRHSPNTHVIRISAFCRGS